MLIAVLILTACDYEPGNPAMQWNPYKRWEVLIFGSEKNERDSIFIAEVETLHQGKTKVLKVNGEVIDNMLDAGKTPDKISFPLMTISIPENADAFLSIRLKTKHAGLFSFETKSITSLEALPKEEIDVYGTMYKDVLILQPDTTAAAYQRDSTPNSLVQKIYWSKSMGLIRYELKDGSVWSLGKRYNL